MLRIGSRLSVVCAVCGLVAVAVPEPARGQKRATFLFGLDFSSDGSLVATCGDRVRVHEVKTGKLVRAIDWRLTRAVAFSPAAADLFAAGGDDGLVRVWRVGNKDAVLELKGHDGLVASLAFDKAGRLLASGSVRFDKGKSGLGQFRLWDVGTGELVHSLDVKAAGINGISFSADGRLVAFCRNAVAEPAADVYRVRAWERVASVRLTAGKLEGTPFGGATLFVGGDKRLIVAGGVCVPATPAEAAPYKGACRPTGLLWGADIGNPGPARLLDDPREDYFQSLAPTPDGKRFVTNGGLTPGRAIHRVEMRDVADGKPVWTAANPGGAAYGVRVSPDGKFVASCAGTGVRVLDAGTGETVRLIPAEYD
jgi:WD40 repeat protein